MSFTCEISFFTVYVHEPLAIEFYFFYTETAFVECGQSEQKSIEQYDFYLDENENGQSMMRVIGS